MTDLRPTNVTAPFGILRDQGSRAEWGPGGMQMKTVTIGRFSSALGIAVAIVVAMASGRTAAAGPQSQDLLDLMAQGKAETDLGHYEAAIRALDAIVEAAEAPPDFRLEALVRLGVARRGSRDFEGAVRAFERVANAPDLDAATKA